MITMFRNILGTFFCIATSRKIVHLRIKKFL